MPATTEPAEMQKRKSSSNAAETSEPVNLDDTDLPRPLYGPEKNCDQVRRKITRLIDSGEIKVGEFCNAIGVTNNSLNRFRSQSGPTKGDLSEVWPKAWEYFEKREIAGLKMPNKNKKAKTSNDGDNGNGNSKANHLGRPDISDIHLPNQDSDSVPVYDSCDEVRRKIAAHLRKPEVTQAQFCRDLYAQMHTDKRPKKFQSSHIDRFRQNKGAKASNTSSVFYAAYVLFEKIRVKEGKPKSKHRQEMENAWPDGFDIEHNPSTG
ncbi:hypothetical protein LTR08_003203 [Meristemomyces frigidus]|nr:hypothetical protein LTR08_003203 [Meristemomyces frigidus]